MERVEFCPAAQELLQDGLRRNLTSRAIAEAIRQQTGEVVSGRTVRRRVTELLRQKEKRAEIRERIQAFTEAMKAADWCSAEVVLALVFGLMVGSPADRFQLAFEARAGNRPARAAGPESEWDRHAWQVVRKLRAALNRGEHLNFSDAEELGALCKPQGARNEGGGGNV